MAEDQGAGRRRDDHLPVTLRWLNKRLLVVLAAISFAISAVVGGAIALYIANQTNDRFRENSINGCDGSNLLRGYARLKTRGTPGGDLASGLLSIRDCPASYDRKRIVVIPAQLEDNYLGLLARGQRVAVRGHGTRFVPMR